MNHADQPVPTVSLTAPERILLAEAVRYQEERSGRPDDTEANRQARAAGGNFRQRVLFRAQYLAQRDGLLDALPSAHLARRLALYLLFILAVVSGVLLAFTTLGNGQRPINLFWTLSGLLGLHFLTLLAWLALTVFGNGQGALGRLWVWLAQKFAHTSQASLLGIVAAQLFSRQKTGRWLLGSMIHGWWFLLLFSSLLMVLLLFTVRRYGFVWESTLLSGDAFVRLTQILGAPPALLGFPTPDPDTIHNTADKPLAAAETRRLWALWLTGVVFAWGLLPRTLAGIFCLWRWQYSMKRLDIDLSLPGYAVLHDKLIPTSKRLGINDAAPDHYESISFTPHRGSHNDAVLVGIELTRAWPPSLPDNINDAGILDDGTQRKHLLEQLTRYPPARLLIACDPQRSPDRGTLALIAELARCAQKTRIWLLPAADGHIIDEERLASWRKELDRLPLSYDGDAPLLWLAHGDRGETT